MLSPTTPFYACQLTWTLSSNADLLGDWSAVALASLHLPCDPVPAVRCASADVSVTHNNATGLLTNDVHFVHFMSSIGAGAACQELCSVAC
jgi:hypothetical protein